jgi:hypothetical protein
MAIAEDARRAGQEPAVSRCVPVETGGKVGTCAALILRARPLEAGLTRGGP